MNQSLDAALALRQQELSDSQWNLISFQGEDNVLSPLQGNPRGIYVPDWTPKQTPKVMMHWITFKPENHSSLNCTALSKCKVWAVGLLTQAKSWALMLQGSLLVYLHSTELHIMAAPSQSKLKRSLHSFSSYFCPNFWVQAYKET